MRVRAGDVSLWFEVLGTKRVADGPRFVERPTIITVHGGPGFDSANGLEGAMPLSEIAQVVVFDQRGHGRSDYSTPDRWNLDTWADDIVALCTALDIERPIVLGTSFGGFVVQRYAARHPHHALAHILVVTMPRFDDEQMVERFRAVGGDEVADFVQRDLDHSTPQSHQEWERLCLPLMSREPQTKEWLAERMARVIRTDEVNLHFANGERRTLDLRPGLHNLARPTLLVVGEMDPVIPPALAREIVDAAPPGLVELVEIPGARHHLGRDAPDQLVDTIRRFVQRVAPAT
jgi:pimeloyl-ACP methyl ester carboxylesterase